MSERHREGATDEQLASFAHEVRGALTVIAGFTEIVRRPLPEAERAAALDGISRAVARIDGLVQSALEGSIAPQHVRERVDLAELAECVAQEQRTLSARDVTVTADPGVAVLGDSGALERALGNLVGNALKYSLLNSAVEVSVFREGEWAVVSVDDRGPGIPEDERERVLKPFERLESHRDVPGSGLGLSIVRDVCIDHGGALEIADREGGGASIRMRLPALRAL
jgi:signal transduction histidine kinase